MDLLAQMRGFVRIVETGSLSAAARAERLSLPAISRQLSALERELGGKLLLRTTRRLQLTDAGRAFYERASSVLRDVERARSVVSDAKGVRGRLTISSGITLGMSEIVPKLPAFLEKHPQLELELRLEDRVVDLVGEGVDVAIRGGVPVPDSPDLIAHRLLRFRRVAVASPAYLRRHPKPRAPLGLSRHVCLLQTPESRARWTLERAEKQQTVEVSGPVCANAPLALKELSLAGVGVALLGELLIEAELESGRLVRLLDGWQTQEVSVWALHRTELRGSAKLAALLKALAA